MASWQEEIRPRQSVWDNHKNGIITGINYELQLVYVDFYNRDKVYRRTYTPDDLIGNWDDKLQQWVIVEI